jgi:putative ABC transport system substrate-binding protein
MASTTLICTDRPGFIQAKYSTVRRPPICRVQQATKVELVVNLKTAKSLGLELPTSVLLSADEVIE